MGSEFDENFAESGRTELLERLGEPVEFVPPAGSSTARVSGVAIVAAGVEERGERQTGRSAVRRHTLLFSKSDVDGVELIDGRWTVVLRGAEWAIEKLSPRRDDGREQSSGTMWAVTIVRHVAVEKSVGTHRVRMI